jgi:chromosome segregation ATPase
MKRLDAQKKALEESVERLRLDLQKESGAVERKSAKVKKLRAQENELPKQLEGTSKEIARLERQINARQHTLTQQETAKRYKMNELNKGVQFYKKFLGLEFMRTAGR